MVRIILGLLFIYLFIYLFTIYPISKPNPQRFSVPKTGHVQKKIGHQPNSQGEYVKCEYIFGPAYMSVQC
uniref:Uncharacterized protein n=1 Tax=Anguilla anguilla TaxID=7936 RepID=A0A0E9X0H3_ANGAN